MLRVEDLFGVVRGVKGDIFCGVRDVVCWIPPTSSRQSGVCSTWRRFDSLMSAFVVYGVVVVVLSAVPGSSVFVIAFGTGETCLDCVAFSWEAIGTGGDE